ncbi:RUS family member 1 [Geodia barretti]|uniref:RUS family member 1 n=1 Tax=Geodia barretti TaxID=519541 RepID=A0AA35VUC0_GEOBA|nr:RUS family member 1 [Geodia barretti]
MRSIEMNLKGDLPRLQEQYGSRHNGRPTATYMCDHIGLRRIKAGANSGLWQRPGKFVKEVFLPQGYPDTVSSDYLHYQLWDTLQAFCSSITTMLATLAVLKGVGVGDDTATPLAATITWMFRDGAGMISKILFAWMKGVDLDCNAKRWRLVADVLNDVGRFLELVAPSLPHLFLPLVCLASVSTAIVGTAGMATRAALVQHQARRNNMADVAAKDNSQETVVNLLGLLVNLWVSSLVAESQFLVWALFTVFTVLHLWANYMAVSVVCMETFNQNRLHIMMEHYLSTGVVLDPATVNTREPIIARSTRILSYRLGANASSVVTSSAEFRAAVARDRDGHKHILKYLPSQRIVLVALNVASSTVDQLQAALSIEVLDYILSGHSSSSSPVLAQFSQDITSLLRGGKGDELPTHVDDKVCSCLFPSLLPALSLAGWDTSHLLLATSEPRYSWTQDS